VKNIALTCSQSLRRGKDGTLKHMYMNSIVQLLVRFHVVVCIGWKAEKCLHYMCNGFYYCPFDTNILNVLFKYSHLLFVIYFLRGISSLNEFEKTNALWTLQRYLRQGHRLIGVTGIDTTAESQGRKDTEPLDCLDICYSTRPCPD